MNTKNTSGTATIERIVEGAFMHAMDECLTDESKKTARNLVNAFKRDYLNGRGEVSEGSPLFLIAQGFIMGVNEGINLARIIDEGGR